MSKQNEKRDNPKHRAHLSLPLIVSIVSLPHTHFSVFFSLSLPSYLWPVDELNDALERKNEKVITKNEGQEQVHDRTHKFTVLDRRAVSGRAPEKIEKVNEKERETMI